MLKKALLFCFVFFLFYSIFGFLLFQEFGSPSNSKDFYVHFYHNEEYAPGYYLFFRSQNVFVFYLLNIFFLTIVFPITLFYFLKNFWVLLFYFFGTVFLQYAVYSATFPSVLGIYFLMIYFFIRNKYYLAALTVLSPFIHSMLLFSCLIVWIIEILLELFKKKGLVFSLLAIPPKYRIESKPAEFLELNTLFQTLLLVTPIPVLYYGLKNADKFYFFLILASFISSLFQLRALLLAELVLIIVCSQAIQKTNKKFKLCFAIYLFLQGLFFFLLYSIQAITLFIS